MMIAPSTYVETELAGKGREEAMKEVKSNPLKDATDLSASGKFVMNDARWPASEGWVEMSKNVNGVEIHFLYNKIKHVFDDFKFVS